MVLRLENAIYIKLRLTGSYLPLRFESTGGVEIQKFLIYGSLPFITIAFFVSLLLSLSEDHFGFFIIPLLPVGILSILLLLLVPSVNRPLLRPSAKFFLVAVLLASFAGLQGLPQAVVSILVLASAYCLALSGDIRSWKHLFFLTLVILLLFYIAGLGMLITSTNPEVLHITTMDGSSKEVIRFCIGSDSKSCLSEDEFSQQSWRHDMAIGLYRGPIIFLSRIGVIPRSEIVK